MGNVLEGKKIHAQKSSGEENTGKGYILILQNAPDQCR